MSKVITSPVKRFPGTVTIADPLTFPQAIAVERCIAAVRALENPTLLEVNNVWVPAIDACVEEWHLEGVNGSIPATPRQSSAKLVAWLINEIGVLFAESEDVPLA